MANAALRALLLGACAAARWAAPEGLSGEHARLIDRLERRRMAQAGLFIRVTLNQ